MQRMGVFVFYDASGIVEKYVEVLLNSMETILQKLIIVVNGHIKNKDYQKLKKYSQNVFVRDNLGFDAGAYKDVFTKYFSFDKLAQWDEIVLFNDTFYGPLYPWETVFDEMSKYNLDFWGLSKFLNGKRGEELIPEHIQSYFLVCRKSLFTSRLWNDFWSNLEYPMTIQEAVINFEINFSVYFTNNGFRSKAFIDNKTVIYKGNPYAYYSYEMIKELKFPVLKRKVIILCRFVNAKKALAYISSNTDYDTELIYSHIKRLKREGKHNIFVLFDETDIEVFYKKHKRIFIYGHGNFGQGMEVYFEYRNWKHNGFIVTKKNDNLDNVYEYKCMHFNENDGIILALGENILGEVYSMIANDLNVSQLLIPNK